MGAVRQIGTRSPFVGRHEELHRLHAAFDRARSGAAAAVLLAGEAGVGKTRLLAELTRHVQRAEAHVLAGRCVDISEAGVPYLPFVEIVDQIRAIQADVLARRPPLSTLVGGGDPEASALPPHPGVADEPDLGAGRVDQLQLFDAVLGVLTELSRESCVVLQIEDLHWSDPSTRDLLSFLLSRLNGQRILVVASYRTDDLQRRHPLRPVLAELVRLSVVERLEVRPFDHERTEELVRALTGDDADPTTVAEIARRCEGNAFFAEELIASGSTSPHAGVPTVLAEILLAKVDQLEPAAQQVVRALSVSGQWQVPHPTVHAVAGLDNAELETALRDAIHHNILVTGQEDAYAFRHSLVREAIYADLLPGERVRLHAAYATYLADRGKPGTAAALAYHSARANDLRTALSASVKAAAEARATGATAAELQHLERALELWDAVPDAPDVTGTTEFSLMRKAAYVAGAAGQPERALAHIRAAVPRADAYDDAVLAADTRRQLAQVLLDNGRWPDADQVIGEAWNLIAHHPASKERAWVLAVRTRVERDDPSRRATAEAAAADARHSGTPGAEADALISLAFVENRAGRFDRAADLLDMARRRAVEAGSIDVELRAVFNLVFAGFDQGHLNAAARHADDGMQRAAQLGVTWSLYGRQIRMMRALIHYVRGDWDTAAEAATPPGEAVSDLISAMLAAAGALVHVGRGEFDDADAVLERLHAQWHRTDDEQIAHLAAAAGAELAGWRGEPARAVHLVNEALEAMPRLSGEPWPLGGIRMAALGLAAHADLLADPLGSSGASDRAASLAAGDALLEHAERTAELGTPRGAELGPEGHAWLLRARAEHARLHGQHRPEMWRRVVDGFGYGDLYQQAIARWRLAEALLAAGERDRAELELAAAARTAQRLRAEPLQTALRSLARRSRIGVDGPPPAGDVLTAREAAVLAEVARGHTNRQIGENLFISEKTVSVHVSRVMAKLGAGSRTEAVALAYQRGLIETSTTG